ncbi:MAG: hypothetical protein SP1CHLAM54_06800 [Chlamydiia bacterium]|nr:hypothetical protein [Chlamydiia bacterium]MCH9615588.1 hypothetical protein [Chlamydiia bacterium]MCH9629243.1 hypothetical protein [Chlamydiia bacterium]
MIRITPLFFLVSSLLAAQPLNESIMIGFKKGEINPKDLPLKCPQEYLVSKASVHYIEDQQAFFKNMARSLKRGGKILLRFCAIKHDPVLMAVQQVTMKRFWHAYFRGYKIPCRAYDRGTYYSYLRSAGLTPTRIDRIAVEEVLENKNAFATWLSEHLPHLTELPSHLKALFIRDVVKCYLKKYPLDTKGHVHVHDYIWEIEACSI